MPHSLQQQKCNCHSHCVLSMVRMRLLCVVVVLALMIILHLDGHAVEAQSACPNDYVYTQQPPQEIACNPYNTRMLMLNCAIIGSDNIEIQWYFSRTNMNENPLLLTSGSKYALTPMTVMDGVGLGLTVNDLNEDEDSGMYWCQAYISQGDSSYLLTASQSFTLYDESFYTFVFFDCPEDIFLRSSDIRCATRIEMPTESPVTSTLLPRPTPSLSSKLASKTSSLLVQSTSMQLPSISSSSLQAPLSTRVSSSSPAPTSTPSESLVSESPMVTMMPAPSPEETEPTGGTDTTSPSTPNASSIQLSGPALYGLAGVIGLLTIFCVATCIVIVVLCRNRRHRVDLEGSEDKESGFDQFSNQSDLMPGSFAFKRRGAHTPYQPDISMISGSGRSPPGSGDYAEIGPALVLLRSQHAALQSMHEYSEIPEVFPHMAHSHVDETTFSREHSLDPYQMPGGENPYDLPILPPEMQDEQQDSVQEPIDAADDEGADSHDYHILERIPPSERSTRQSEERKFSSPPVSPHNYHTLESPSETPHISIPTRAEKSPSWPLEPIPEHPYHTLEESISIENATGSEVQDPEINSEVAEITPEFTDPEISVGALIPDMRKEDDDGGYDRLVGPPQLYHILEQSPSAFRPRIREFPGGYSYFEGISGQPAARFLGSQVEETSTLSNSSADSGDMFDDPQYNVSPKRKQPLGKAKSDTGGIMPVHMCTPFRGTPEAVNLAKYRGDYERDPTYMERLRKRSAEDTDSPDYTPVIVSGLPRRSSLPEFSHIYQTLEQGTMDPKQEYEKLRKRKETAL